MNLRRIQKTAASVVLAVSLFGGSVPVSFAQDTYPFANVPRGVASSSVMSGSGSSPCEWWDDLCHFFDPIRPAQNIPTNVWIILTQSAKLLFSAFRIIGTYTINFLTQVLTDITHR